MKKVLLIIVGVLFWLAFTFADDFNDCQTNIKEAWDYGDIMDIDSINKAIENLNGFCDFINEKEGAKEIPAPQSKSLFDHIFDVFMRRLDAKEENKHWDNLLYELTPDDKWKEWRDFVTAKWDTSTWVNPIEFKNKTDDLWQNNWNNLIYDSRGSNLKNRNISNYSGWTLFERYNSACEISAYLFFSIKWEKITTEFNNWMQKCKELVKKRIENEFLYTNAIIKSQSTKYLVSNNKTYLDEYFAQNKLTTLQELVFNMTNTFWDINSFVKEFVDECQ